METGATGTTKDVKAYPKLAVPGGLLDSCVHEKLAHTVTEQLHGPQEKMSLHSLSVCVKTLRWRRAEESISDDDKRSPSNTNKAEEKQKERRKSHTESGIDESTQPVIELGRNYGGVYVGLPSDAAAMAPSQTKAAPKGTGRLLEGNKDIKMQATRGTSIKSSCQCFGESCLCAEDFDIYTAFQRAGEIRAPKNPNCSKFQQW
ncbi:hypothetical protein EK904_012894, partial [Melospiza melodia maxima]